MLIPSIDLQDGAVVQLVQGERLAIRDADVFRWVRRFAKFPKVQVIDLGWKTALPLTAVEAVQALEPYCDEFLYTHVDTEGLMTGTSIDAILAVRAATSRRLTAAGGITTRAEIDALHASGIDAVVGMAIYTGALDLDVPDQV